MKLSVVIPVMNEADNIRPLFEALSGALASIEHEIILVDDGSTDSTVAEITRLAPKNARLVVLNKNYGQTTAMAAGIEQAAGELIVTIDGDLQNDPADIPMMIRHLEDKELDVVAGRRAGRKDGMLLRKIPSRIANAMIRNMTDVHIRDYGCTLKLFRREVARNLGLYGELHRFIPVLVDLYGGKMEEVDVRHHARQFGVSKYGIGRTTRVMSDLLFMVFFQKWGQKPMRSVRHAGLHHALRRLRHRPLPGRPQTPRKRDRRPAAALARHHPHLHRHPADHDRLHRRVHHAHLLRVAEQETLHHQADRWQRLGISTKSCSRSWSRRP